MAYHPGLQLTTVTVGGASTLESGDSLLLVATITATRSLLWVEGNTSWHYDSDPKTVEGILGAELSFEILPCNISGFRTQNNQIIDVSAPGSYTHLYNIRVSKFKVSGGKRSPVGTTKDYSNVFIPTGDGSPVDLDTLLPVGTQAGGVVLVPDSWGGMVAAAEAAAVAAADVAEVAVNEYLTANPPPAGPAGPQGPKGDTGDYVIELRTDTNLASDVAAAWVFEDGSIAARLFRDGTMDAKIGTAPATGLGLVAYGDSTTYGADLADPAGQRWTTLLGDALGRIVANRGLSGARAEEIAAFAGGVTITGTVTGDSIPAAGNAALASSSLDVDPWRAGMGPVFGPRFPVLAVIDGDTPIPGELIYQNASLRYFARSTPGAAIPTTTLEMLASDTSGTLFLGAGTNNVPLVISGTQTVDDVVAWYRAITEAWTGPVIVWGILDRGYNERPGTATGDVIDDLDARLASGYGSHYVPVRRYLSSPRALTDAARLVPGFDATAEDLTAQSVGRTPPSFRAAVSSVHLNALGHRLQARLLHRHMILRGLA